jgi:2-polyprenyl-3-methyl-5-hydroxy-6-metoxy-1,4-benzoquinol methylase
MPSAEPRPDARAVPRCRICGGPTRGAFTLHSHRHAVDVPVTRCDACDAFFSNGGPVNYDDVDLTGYYLQFADAIRARYERVFERIEALRRPGRFLDIGAGMGFSLEVARRRGWSAAGLEPNRALARHAAGRGLAVANRYLDGSEHGEHDFVLVDNVLEHVPEPLAFLRHAARLLAPQGLLLVAVPPLDWLRKALAAFPYVRDRVTAPQLNVFGEVDEHLNMLGRRAMGRLVDNAGLRLQPLRWHHSPVFDNPLVRTLGLDDGYYLIST